MNTSLTPRLTQLFAFLEADPSDAFTRYSIAYEYTQSKQWEEAIFHYTKLLEDHPTYVAAYYHLGKTYEQLNAGEQARTTYETGIAAARNARDRHALAELQSALAELEEENN